MLTIILILALGLMLGFAVALTVHERKVRKHRGNITLVRQHAPGGVHRKTTEPVFTTPAKPKPYVNPHKDRTLAGKARRRAQRVARAACKATTS